jgi:hypothetical protein
MAEKKQTKKIKVRDLKPRKDAKGGRSLDRSVDRSVQRSVDRSVSTANR